MIREEAAVVHEQLTQARELLRDGMAKLAESFTETRQAVLMRDQLTADYLAASDLEERERLEAALREHRENMQRRTDAGMLGLQVEDMLGQLIEQVRARSSALAALAAALGRDFDRAVVQADVERVRELDELVAALRAAAQSVFVTQSSADAGEVELF